MESLSVFQGCRNSRVVCRATWACRRAVLRPSFVNENATAVTWQLSGGLEFYATDNLALYGGYRYQRYQEAEFGDSFSYNEITTHNVEFGLRLEF